MLYTADADNYKISGNIVTPDGEVIATKDYSNTNNADGSANPYYQKYYFYHYDLRGSVTSLLKPDTTLEQGYTYDEFGNAVEAKTSNFKGEIAYTGAIKDKTTGLTYLSSRYYNSVTGRFTSQDTYYGSKYAPMSQHLYTYTGNNPVNYVDPTGHGWFSKVVDFMGGFCLSVSKNVTFGIVPKLIQSIAQKPFIEPDTQAYSMGKIAGDVFSIVSGVNQIVKGVTTAVVGVAADVTGVGILAVLTANAVGVAEAVYGAGVVSSGIVNIGKDWNAFKGAGGGVDEGNLPTGDKITGYTKHGAEQALGRDGGIGVSNKAITDAVNNPVEPPIPQPGGTTKYIGKDATVVLNQDGKVVTTWANSSAGTR